MIMTLFNKYASREVVSFFKKNYIDKEKFGTVRK